MKSLHCVDFLICSIVLIVAIVEFTDAELEQSKNRRGGGGTSGLFAFPRVGRSDSSMSNALREPESVTFENLYPNSLEDYDDFAKSNLKRANLIAFPRVGRNDADWKTWMRYMALQRALDTRTAPSATSGLWFGSHLGKRSVNTNDDTTGVEKTAVNRGQTENY